MGKRKKSMKKVVKKVAPKLAVVFNCPKCSYPKCVKCVINSRDNIGMVECSVCKASWKMSTSLLTEPVDVYAKWIDELEKANRQTNDIDTPADNSDDENENNSDGY